jgi:hypothetical protein
MAITVQLSDTNPHVSNGLTTKRNVSVITRADLDELIPKAFDIRLFQCGYVESAFAEFGGVIVDEYKNDKTDLLFGLSLVTDTVTLQLFKEGTNGAIATITDNTYGTFFPASFFPDQLKTGFLADWNLILDAFGSGVYHFVADRTIISRDSTLTSHDFKLRIFDEQIADGTIKVVTTQTGVIEGGVNYDGFEWEGHIRLYGFFGTPEYEFIDENLITTGRSKTQIQAKIKTVYTMNLKLHPSSVMVQFIKDRLLASEMTITPYGIFDFLERYRDIPVYPEGIEESNYFEQNSNGQFIIAFTDKVQTPIKRRFT